MIENVKALENLDNILKTKYLDAIFIGPYDLSASLGIPGDFNNKIFINAIKKIKEKCKKYKNPIWNSCCGADIKKYRKNIKRRI